LRIARPLRPATGFFACFAGDLRCVARSAAAFPLGDFVKARLPLAAISSSCIACVDARQTFLARFVTPENGYVARWR
jgi:hypothetical protein